MRKDGCDLSEATRSDLSRCCFPCEMLLTGCLAQISVLICESARNGAGPGSPPRGGYWALASSALSWCGFSRVGARRLTAFRRQVSKRPPPNRTYTSRCIRLSRYQSSFPACSLTWQSWQSASVLRLRAIMWRSHSTLPDRSFSFRTW